MGANEPVLKSWLIDWLQHPCHSSTEFERELTAKTASILPEQLKRGTLDNAFAEQLGAAANGDGPCRPPRRPWLGMNRRRGSGALSLLGSL